MRGELKKGKGEENRREGKERENKEEEKDLKRRGD